MSPELAVLSNKSYGSRYKKLWLLSAGIKGSRFAEQWLSTCGTVAQLRSEYSKAKNGQIIAVSEGYTAIAGCLKGVESVRKNTVDPEIEMEE